MTLILLANTRQRHFKAEHVRTIKGREVLYPTSVNIPYNPIKRQKRRSNGDPERKRDLWPCKGRRHCLVRVHDLNAASFQQAK
jgi:hypothetical protein